MNYTVEGIGIECRLNEGDLERCIDEYKEELEFYEELSISVQCNEIRIDAFNITNGDYRHLVNLDVYEYLYAEVREF